MRWEFYFFSCVMCLEQLGKVFSAEHLAGLASVKVYSTIRLCLYWVALVVGVDG